jgi:hypothetical protein
MSFWNYAFDYAVFAFICLGFIAALMMPSDWKAILNRDEEPGQ